MSLKCPKCGQQVNLVDIPSHIEAGFKRMGIDFTKKLAYFVEPHGPCRTSGSVAEFNPRAGKFEPELEFNIPPIVRED